MKRFGSGLMIVAVVVLLASLFAARAVSRQDSPPQAVETSPSCPVVEGAAIDQTTDGCSPIPPAPKPMPAVSTNQPTLAPPPDSSALAAQVIYERHPRGQAISIQVEVEGTP